MGSIILVGRSPAKRHAQFFLYQQRRTGCRLRQFRLLSHDAGAERVHLYRRPVRRRGPGFNLVLTKCLRAGTRILTQRGDVPLEGLFVGERVHTVLDGAAAPIAWIGHRDVDCVGHPKPRQVWPVRVAAGAFGPGRPHTDLFLSPDHAVYLNEVLIPVRHLINASTITQVLVDQVTYCHIELSRHDVVLA
jgi:hypothetical protein